MGFTPLEGVPMATRPGSVDPGALLYLLRRELTLDELDRALEHESGLLGLSGLSGDVRELEASDDPAARLALDVFAYRVATAVGAMAAALDGLDALVFTAGIGEHSADVRARVCARLGFLGVDVDPALNERAAPDAEIAREGSPVRVVVLGAREDVVAARAARERPPDGLRETSGRIRSCRRSPRGAAGVASGRTVLRRSGGGHERHESRRPRRALERRALEDGGLRLDRVRGRRGRRRRTPSERSR